MPTVHHLLSICRLYSDVGDRVEGEIEWDSQCRSLLGVGKVVQSCTRDIALEAQHAK
jgi:hypothetical protein